LAAIAGVMVALAVVGAVVPVLVQAEAERATQARDALQGLAWMAQAQDLSLEQVHQNAAVDAVAWLDAVEQVESQVGAHPDVEAFARLCPPGLMPGSVAALGPLPGRDQISYAACAGGPDGRMLLVQSVASPWKQARQALLLALLSGLAAGGAVSFTVSRMLAPVQSLTEAARTLARSEPVQPVTATGELRPLADALNQLGSAQQAREEALRGRLDLTRQLGAVVAHEVRNPLQSITMLADVVAHEPDPAERQSVLEDLQEELRLIEQVVHRLVDSGDDLHLVRRELDLGDVVRRAVASHAARAREADIQLAASGLEAVPWVGDGALLRRAVENLVHNAVEVLAERGGSLVQVHLGQDAGTVWIAVSDDGPGVPEEERERIFQAGYTARSGGSGLGLTLARKVAQAHGGSLAASSSELGGARFVLEMPTS
jgi:signal transduction histidine kinase